jgi:hypothetical protein
MNSVLAHLVNSRKFWLAVFAVIQSIVFASWPSFPPDVWQAIDGLVIVLITSIAAEDVAAKLGASRSSQ